MKVLTFLLVLSISLSVYAEAGLTLPGFGPTPKKRDVANTANTTDALKGFVDFATSSTKVTKVSPASIGGFFGDNSDGALVADKKKKRKKKKGPERDPGSSLYKFVPKFSK